ncbi:MAG: hypothetical protein FJ279_32805 [Planctomycetes bacterium]|nr:hypothetical protein [Planctomycetota bacterium]
MGLLIASLLVLAFACFHALSVTFLNPPAANRAFPARLTLAGVWLAAGILALMADARGVTYNALSVWAYATLVASGVGLAIAVSERDQLGLRVKRAVPRGGLLRALAFPFFSGSASGILWACLLMGVTSVALPFLDWGFRARPIRSETAHRILTLFLYSFSYALTAAWLRNRFLSEWFSAKYTGILALFLAGAGIWLPFLFDLLVWDMTFDQVMRYSQHFGSILTVLGPRSLEEILRHELFAGIWAAAVLALNFPWLLKQVAAFFRAPVRSSARQGASATFRRLVRKPVSR